MRKKRVCVLGSTGSVGRNALRMVSALKDRFEITGLSAHSNAALLAEQAKKFRPRAVAIADKAKAARLRSDTRPGIRILAGEKGIEELAARPDADIVLMAISGGASIGPTYSAVSHGRDIALASKEALVSAGHLIMREAKRKGSAIVPVDSEHSAVFQCLAGNKASDVRRLYITASGGPLWNVPRRRFANLSADAVLRHPKWKMGKKISVDSATMINKGLEVIEAKWLFGIGVDRIKVLMHPEAIVHSMVEFTDGSVLAQLGITDMRLPIQYALSYPERHKNGLRPLDLAGIRNLTFHRPDMVKFPSLGLAYSAAKAGGSAPCVLSSANEMAVRAFLRGRIRFTDIARIVENALSRHKRVDFPSLDEIRRIEDWAKEEVKQFCLSR